jgi:hypothetical protein
MSQFYIGRATTVEALLFKDGLPANWLLLKAKKHPTTDKTLKSADSIRSPDVDAVSVEGPESQTEMDTDGDSAKAAEKEKETIADPADKRIKNVKYLKFLVNQLPNTVMPLLQGKRR